MALARWQATITDEAGNIVPNASIEVRRESSGQPLVSLFSDRDGQTPIGNPFNADGDGFAAFHVTGGAYQITATSGAFSRTWRYVGIGLASEQDAPQAGVAFAFDSGVTDADPGAGRFRLNNASPALATQIYIDNENFDGVSQTAWLDTFDNLGEAANRGQILLRSSNNEGFLLAVITGSVVDASGYRRISITPLAASPASTFVADAVYGVIFVPAPVPAGGGGLTAPVLYSEIQDVSAASRILGRSGLGSGDIQELTLTQILDFVGSAANGDMLVRLGGSWSRLAVGTLDQVLTVQNDASSPPNLRPVWATPASAAWDYEAEVLTTSGTALTIASGIPAGVQEIEIMLEDVSTDSNNQQWEIRLGDAGGIESSGYTSAADASGGSFTSETNGFLLNSNSNIDAANQCDGNYRLIRYNSANSQKWHIRGLLFVVSVLYQMVGWKELSGDLTQIQLTTANGTSDFDNGRARVRYR